MASTRTKFTVGLFLIAGTLLAAASVIWIGMSGAFATGKHYVIYFDESVQGLSKDSQVKYRGVSIGRVKKIEVAPDGNLIEVIIQVEQKKMPMHKIVAQLKSVGITGIMFIELDRYSKTNPPKPISLSFSAPYPVIPSRPSDIKELLDDVEKMIKSIQSIDYKGISVIFKKNLEDLNKVINEADVKAVSDRVIEVLDRVNHILDKKQWDKILESFRESGADLTKAIAEARGAIREINTTFKHADGILGKNEKGIQESVNSLRTAIKKAEKAINNGDVLITGTDERVGDITRHLIFSLQNIEKATSNLNNLLMETSRDPSSLILGKPPLPRPVEKYNKKGVNIR